MFTECGLK